MQIPTTGRPSHTWEQAHTKVAMIRYNDGSSPRFKVYKLNEVREEYEHAYTIVPDDDNDAYKLEDNLSETIKKKTDIRLLLC